LFFARPLDHHNQYTPLHLLTHFSRAALCPCYGAECHPLFTSLHLRYPAEITAFLALAPNKSSRSFPQSPVSNKPLGTT
jgi:hypothetical protein